MPGVANAAPPWSISGDVSPALAGGAPPALSAGTGGRQLGVARPPSGPGADLLALDGATVGRRRASRTVVASARYGRTRVLHLDAASTKPCGRGDAAATYPTRVRIAARVGTADLRTFGTSRAIGGPRTVRGCPVLAVAPDGGAIAAWNHVRRGRTDEVQISTRAPGGRFRAPRTIQDDDVVSDQPRLAVGIDGAGRALVAYARSEGASSRPTRIAARVVDVGTGRVAGETRVAPPSGQRGPAPGDVAVAARPDAGGGPLAVAWRAYGISEGPTTVVDAAAAVIPAGRRTFAGTRAQRLDDGDLVAYPDDRVRASVDAAGRVIVAFSSLRRGAGGEDARSVPLVAQTGADGRFGTPAPLGDAGVIGDLAVRGGSVAVAWRRQTPGTEGHGRSLGVVVSRRGAGDAFAPAELVDEETVEAPGAPVGQGSAGLPALQQLTDGRLQALYATPRPNARTRAATRPAG